MIALCCGPPVLHGSIQIDFAGSNNDPTFMCKPTFSLIHLTIHSLRIALDLISYGPGVPLTTQGRGKTNRSHAIG